MADVCSQWKQQCPVSQGRTIFIFFTPRDFILDVLNCRFKWQVQKCLCVTDPQCISLVSFFLSWENVSLFWVFQLLLDHQVETPVTVGRWMAIRKSRERDVFVFFLSWKVFRRGSIIFIWNRVVVCPSLSWHWVAVCSRWQTTKQKKNDQRMTRFPPFLSTACQRATKVGRPAIFLNMRRVETFFFDLKRDEWKFCWNIFLSF